ncbi:Uncharacterised protein [Brevibacillus brevis]|nr:Uncharacterised protein [Brevibacillus brevis]
MKKQHVTVTDLRTTRLQNGNVQLIRLSKINLGKYIQKRKIC